MEIQINRVGEKRTKPLEAKLKLDMTVQGRYPDGNGDVMVHIKITEQEIYDLYQQLIHERMQAYRNY